MVGSGPDAARSPGAGRIGAPGEAYRQAGHLVESGLTVGHLVGRRPVGVTAHQWATASHAVLSFVLREPGDGTVRAVVRLGQPAPPGSPAARDDRMVDAVCAAAGLASLRIGTSGPRPLGRPVLDYVLEARRYARLTATAEGDPPAVGYRDLTGRLPDGRTGYVNDLGVSARAAAIEAYGERRIADPMIRGAHVTWRDGGVEGLAWLYLDADRCLLERSTLHLRDFDCGLDPARLAEDLAVAAIGDRLVEVDRAGWQRAGPVSRAQLLDLLDGLRARRGEMRDGFGVDHVLVP